MMKTKVMSRLFPCLCCLIIGCGKSKPPASDEPVGPTNFPFTATNTVVESKDIPLETATQTVEADFNLDGLNDVALVEAAGNNKNEVTLMDLTVKTGEGDEIEEISVPVCELSPEETTEIESELGRLFGLA